MRFVMQTRQDNDVIDHKVMVYFENEIEFQWSIELGIVCD